MASGVFFDLTEAEICQAVQEWVARNRVQQLAHLNGKTVQTAMQFTTHGDQMVRMRVTIEPVGPQPAKPEAG